jgi:hypothetical protein
MCNKRILPPVFILLLIITGCGSKKAEKQNIQTLRITLSGLDGQGLAEDRIRKVLNELQGIKKINFDYLYDCLYINYDSTKTTRASIIQAIQSIEANKYKILEIESAISPENQKIPSPPPSQDQEIGDDVNIYKNDV